MAESYFANPLLTRWAETWNADERVRFSAMPIRSDLTPAQLLDKLSGMAVCNFAIDRLVKSIDRQLAAQYRSRRRLLARECERRAEHWERLHRHSEQRVCEAETWADRQDWRRFAASDRARCAKYARWANQLKDSP